MGYTTDFEGQFKLDKPLRPEHKAYRLRFSQTRRMSRDASKTEKLSDPIREAVGLPIGDEGGYYVGDADRWGQSETPDILDFNEPPDGQPELWCKWAPTPDGDAIEWDGNEKFYSYVEWLKYLIHHFLAPWGYTLDGEVVWSGEDREDIGKIVVENNEVQAKSARIVYD